MKNKQVIGQSPKKKDTFPGLQSRFAVLQKFHLNLSARLDLDTNILSFFPFQFGIHEII